MSGRENAAKSKKASAALEAKRLQKQQVDEKYIQASLRRKVEDTIEVFNKEFYIKRPYCNRVSVKLPKAELL